MGRYFQYWWNGRLISIAVIEQGHGYDGHERAWCRMAMQNR